MFRLVITILILLVYGVNLINASNFNQDNIKVDFEDISLGIYKVDALKINWNNPTFLQGFDTNRAEIIEFPLNNKCLKVIYPKQKFGSKNSGIQFKVNLEKSVEEVYYSYKVFFVRDFDFNKGGKLPGVAGGDIKYALSGNKSDGIKAWSVRAMWRKQGQLVQYIYHPNQLKNYGDDFIWKLQGKEVFIQPEKWHLIETKIKLNTPTLNDGIIQVWFDKKMVLNLKNFKFRKVSKLKIDQFIFCTFFGGNNKSWAPKNECYAYFDNIVIIKKNIMD